MTRSYSGSHTLSSDEHDNRMPSVSHKNNKPVFLLSVGMDTDNFSLLTEKDTVKFVTGSLADCERAVEIMKQFRLIGRCHLYFSPVFGSIDPADIVEFMKEQQLNGVNLQIQMHKVIWDPDRRGV